MGTNCGYKFSGYTEGEARQICWGDCNLDFCTEQKFGFKGA